jgi:DNA-binding NarL/FixJ family response regulator
VNLLTNPTSEPAAFMLRHLQAPSLHPAAGTVSIPKLMPVRVAVIAGDAQVRHQATQELAADRRTELVAWARTLREGQLLVGVAPLDVLLVELHLEDGSGLQLVTHLKERRPSAAVIVMTRSDDEEAAVRAFDLGAAGWLVLHDGDASLVLSVLNVAHGGAVLSASLARRLMHRPPVNNPAPAPMHATVAALTRREREVLEQVALGLRSKEIARRLTISGETVNAHVKSIYRKLQVHSRAQLVRMASQAGVF